MTAPRQILAGSTYLITHRISERRFFLRPSKLVNAILAYLLAVISKRYGVLLHAACVLSNHLHIVLTDPGARLPEFQRDLDSLAARAVNGLLGRWGPLFDRDALSVVRLETPDAILAKMAYVLANPVAAGLVRRGREWPGLWSAPALIGRGGTVLDRPEEFFREDGPLPPQAVLRFDRPPAFEKDPGFTAELLHQLEREEDRAATGLGKAGRSFLGVAKVLAQKWYGRPATSEPRWGLRPRIACRNKWKRVEALRRLKRFLVEYEEALDAWRDGQRDVTFPPGTWLMRVLHGVRCAEA